MIWNLIAQVPNGDHTAAFALQDDSEWDVVLITDGELPPCVGVTQKLLPQEHLKLGHITVQEGIVKLEAVDQSLSVTPDQAAIGQCQVKYQLKSVKDGRVEVLLLRDGDLISSDRSPSTITCKLTRSEVQVNSSAADTAVARSVNSNGNNQNSESSPHEESDGKHPTTAFVMNSQSRSQQSRATPVPRLLNQRSIIVQETPVATRIYDMADDTKECNQDEYDAGATKRTSPASEVELQLADEANSSTPTRMPQSELLLEVSEERGLDISQIPTNTLSSGVPAPETDLLIDDKLPKRLRKSPEVQPRPRRKRPSPDTGDSKKDGQADNDHVDKRARTDANGQSDTQDSRLSAIDVKIPSEIGTTPRTRTSATDEISDAQAQTPILSQWNLQKSKPTRTDYEGPAPRLLLSNSSSITKSSQVAKWLKKQGGALVDSLTDDFDMLCVRDGELHKTPKLLAAIARGALIVTDKWLFESAKAGHLLAISSYIPSAPEQEREWNINLNHILGQPKRPFEDCTIHFTKTLKAFYSPFSDIEQVCIAAGAKKVTSGRLDKTEDAIVLAKDDDDGDAQKLMQAGVTCYNKDLITQSIFQGSLDSREQFRIGQKKATTPTARDRKKKPQKSK